MSCEYLAYMLSPEGLTMASNKVQIIQDWPELRKVKDIQSFLGFTNFYHRFIYEYSQITVPLTQLTHSLLDTPNTVETDASDYTLAAVLSIMTPSSELHPVAFHSCTFHELEHNYDVHDKELLTIFEAFTQWQHYLKGSGTPVDVVMDHWNLQYFSTTKILTHCQARWSEFLSRFNLVIRFCPGKLGTKPDALTRRWDVYLKEGNSDYATANPQNLRPVFTSKQLASSLRATAISVPVLRGSLIMDTERLHVDIKSQL